MKLDQCLFGYDDGHKLLASSLSLGAETSYLTELSDLAPGTIFGSSDGYWTGIPAPAIGRYVLMRTWPAPEMPRPGCVWTHALLIEPSLLESLEDLSVLKDFTFRPVGAVDIESYRHPLEINYRASKKISVRLDEEIVRGLIVSLYGKGSPSILVSSPGEVDDCLFAVWSQQWPRLRRNLRFQSAASRINHSSSPARFDITTLIGGYREFFKEALTSSGGDWVEAAIRDVQLYGGGELRRFLWAYGTDVKRQRNSFRPLVELGLINNGSHIDEVNRVVDLVSGAFPTHKDAAHLKQDLIDGVLVASAQVEILSFFVSSNGESVFPAPSKQGVERLVSNPSAKSGTLLGLAELVAEKFDDVSMGLFEAITSRVDLTNFWSDTVNFPLLRHRLVQERPQLLLEAEVSELSDEYLVENIHLISEGSMELDGFVFRMLSRKSRKLVNMVFETFPTVLARQIICAENDSGSDMDDVWRAALIQRPRLLLSAEVLGRIHRTSVLYHYANGLGWIGPEVFSAGSGPWVSALQSADNDLKGEEKGTLYSFVLILALITKDRDSVKAVELLFDAVHTMILNNELIGRAREITSHWLPEIGWYKGWDLGLRLRLMVVEGYVQQSWSTKSFASLSVDPKTRLLLADAASDVSGGKVFAKAIKR